MNDKLKNVVVTIAFVFIIVIFTVCTAYLVDSSYNPFLYFRF